MHGESRRLPHRRAASGAAAAVTALLVTAAPAAAPAAALAPAAARAATAEPRCGGDGARPSVVRRAQEAARPVAYRAPARPAITAKLPATLRRGAAATRVDVAVRNGTRRTYRHVRTGVAVFGAGKVSDDQGVFLTAADVHVDQYVPGRGWHRVALETGCDPSLGQTLWPANGFTLRPGATFHTALRIAVTRHASAKIHRADLDVSGYTSGWTADRYRSVRLTG